MSQTPTKLFLTTQSLILATVVVAVSCWHEGIWPESADESPANFQQVKLNSFVAVDTKAPAGHRSVFNTKSEDPHAAVTEKFLETYCFDCHNDSTTEGGLDLETALEKDQLNGSLLFENVITRRMPPADATQPNRQQRQRFLTSLAAQEVRGKRGYRRMNRHEFNYAVNDLLNIDVDVSQDIPDDRGTSDFDSDRRILLTREMLSSYFTAADKMLEFAFPTEGFIAEKVWKTNQIKDSHQTYNIYTRPYRDGILFSWTRANNGNSYSFFYDKFEPPVSGWYELTFEAAKVGSFPEDVTLQVHAGKYYFADDRPQPQRLVEVFSLSNVDTQSYKTQVFLNPGENVSVHGFSKHTWRKNNPQEGVYIKQLTACGPLTDGWPPESYKQTFSGLELKTPNRKTVQADTAKSNLARIGGSVSVSSAQAGMEKGKMLDGSNRTFWHTQFHPTLAKPPHFVILKNPNSKLIKGLNYSTWSGGNGNGQIKSFEIYVTDDLSNWGQPLLKGNLETRLAADQPIRFPRPVKNQFIKFLITDSYSIDGRSLASIGKLDVITEQLIESDRIKIVVESDSVDELKRVLQSFAEKAFTSSLTDRELSPYFEIAIHSLENSGNFIEATKQGIKAMICSPRFLLSDGFNRNRDYQTAALLARSIWRSLPDQQLLDLARSQSLSEGIVREQIARMLLDKKSSRMIRSFCQQWLNLRSFKKISPSLKLYPLYDDLLEHYLPLETEHFLWYVVVENLPVGTLIDSDFCFLNQRLAQHYGIENIYGQKLRRVDLNSASPRGGLLTMGSILKVTTDGFETSPILRGAWISQNIAGNTLLPPPENVKAIESDTTSAKSIREQIKLHQNSENCASCHRRIDPYGFALENFDATGQWRDRYKIIKSHPGTFQYRREGYFQLSGTVDSNGEIDGRPFQDISGLKKILLSDHRKVAYNLMKKYFEFINGYQPSLRQRLQLFSSIPDDAADCRIRNLLTEVLIQSLPGQRLSDESKNP